MKLKLAAVLAALVSATFLAAPSPAQADITDVIEKRRKAKAEKEKARAKEAKAKEARSPLKKGKGHAKGQDKK